MKRKLVSLLLVLMLLGSILLPVHADKPAQTTFYISTVQEFMNFARNCQLDSWSKGKTFYLSNDIDLSGIKVSAIPIFTGTFDGQGYSLKGITLNVLGSVQGLFRYNFGTIRNLNAEIYIKSTDNSKKFGGIAAVNFGMIYKCNVVGEISGESTCGGVVGDNRGEINLSTFTGKVSCNHYAGGIAGINREIIISCTNKGSVNPDIVEGTTADSETTFSFDFGKISELINTETLPTTTDAGGIAGYSEGRILSCQNLGAVGYYNVGYNIGGIVGRQSGLVSDCDNRGVINGRKDIGGIVGQNEPYVRSGGRLNETLQEELNLLYDMIDTLIYDSEIASDQISNGFREVLDAAKKAGRTGEDLADLTVDFINDNMQELNELMERISTIEAMLFPAMQDAMSASDLLLDSLDDLSQGMEEMIISDEMSIKEKKDVREAIRIIAESTTRLADSSQYVSWVLKVYYNDHEDGYYDLIAERPDNWEETGYNYDSSSLNTRSKQIAAMLLAAMEAADASADTLTAASVISDILYEYYFTEDAAGKTRLDRMGDAFEASLEEFEQAATYLNSAMDQIGLIAEYLANNDPLKFRNLDETYSNQLEKLKNDINSVWDSIDDSNDISNEALKTLLEDLRKVNNQFNKVLSVFGELITLNGATSETILVDESEEVMDDTISGKITGCENRAAINGNRNVGGITGSMALEYDFNPNTDISGFYDNGVLGTYHSRCIISDSINYGDVISKNEHCGGVCGLQETGIVGYCENYGAVSGEASYDIGGVVGYSLSTIYSCHAKCVINALYSAGGITGYGTIIKRCNSMVQINCQGEKVGAIAGSVSDSATIGSNFFESDTLGGIDGVSYENGACPVDFNEISDAEILPSGFHSFELKFVADNVIIKTIQFNYGDSIPQSEIPAVPGKEGYTGHWPSYDYTNLKFSDTITAVYEPLVSVISSKQLSEDGSNALVLAEGSFGNKATLVLSDSSYNANINDDPLFIYNIVIEDAELTSTSSIKYRILIDDANSRYKTYLRIGNNWEEISTLNDGKYLVFATTARALDLYVVKTGLSYRSPLLLILVSVAALIVLGMVAFVIIKIRKKHRDDGKEASGFNDATSDLGIGTPESQNQEFMQRISSELESTAEPGNDGSGEEPKREE